MTTTDRTPIILALLSDLIRERVLAAPDDADLLHLSDGLALAVDHGAAAAAWPPDAVDRDGAMFVDDVLVRGDRFGMENNWSMVVAIARRLTDVAASMLVRGDIHRAEADALWKAAGRLLGLQDEAPEQVDRERLQVHVDLATAMAQRDPQMTYVATAGGVVVESNRTVDLRDQTIRDLRADLASMTEQRDLLKRQLEELRGDMQKGTEPNPDNRDSYRSTVLRAGAKDCALFIGPGPRDLTFVVEMRNGCKVFDVVAALEHHHGLAPESYRIREVRTETTSNG